MPIPHRKDIPQTHVVRVDIADVPAHETVQIPIASPIMPGLSSMVTTLSQRELLLEKMIAVIERSRMKWRDVFDIWFLSVQGISMDMDMMRRKLEDHRISNERLRASIDERRAAMTRPGAADRYLLELSRFIHNVAGYLSIQVAEDAARQTAALLEGLVEPPSLRKL